MNSSSTESEDPRRPDSPRPRSVTKASALLWAFIECDNGNGASKQAIVEFLAAKFERDEGFDLRADAMLACGVALGMLRRDGGGGGRYYLQPEHRAECAARNRTGRSRSPIGRKRSRPSAESGEKSADSGEKSADEGVAVIERALHQLVLKDEECSTLESIKRIVVENYEQYANFDRVFEDARRAAEAVERNVLRHML